MVNIKIIQLIFLDDCFRQFGWDTVTAFSQNEEVYSLAVNELVTQLEAANITCAASITFAESDFKEQLQQLKVTWVLRPSSAFQFIVLTRVESWNYFVSWLSLILEVTGGRYILPLWKCLFRKLFSLEKKLQTLMSFLKTYP